MERLASRMLDHFFYNRNTTKSRILSQRTQFITDSNALTLFILSNKLNPNCPVVGYMYPLFAKVLLFDLCEVVVFFVASLFGPSILTLWASSILLHGKLL